MIGLLFADAETETLGSAHTHNVPYYANLPRCTSWSIFGCTEVCLLLYYGCSYGPVCLLVVDGVPRQSKGST